MEKVFQQILQMSIYGSIAIIAVFILRRCFSRLPKRITCLFWLIPIFRLLCPLNFGTGLSVMNIAKLSENADVTIHNAANAVIPAVMTKPDTAAVQETLDRTVTHTVSAAVPEFKTIAAYIWMLGMIIMLTYLGIKTIKMLMMLKTARKAPDRNYYVSDAFDTSFVVGILRPRIYMQSGMSEKEEAYVLEHERTHIRNLDHITKLIGVLTVCLHWFNPFVWIAFVKMCADLEMRCDETVIESMGDKIKKDYCRSIVKHALDRDNAERGLYAAFAGDNFSQKEIKMRIKNIINYKKISKVAAVGVVVFALGTTVVLSTKAQNMEESTSQEEMTVEEELATYVPDTAAEAEDTVEQATAEAGKVGKEQEDTEVGGAVSVPGNILLDMTEEECLANYGKEEFVLPDDVEYSDEGRPYSKTYDYRDTPILNRLGAIIEKDGYEILDPDTEYLDREGNVQVGRELYCFNAWKEVGDKNMLLNVYMVSEDYARDSYNEIREQNGIWVGGDVYYGEDEDWYVYRLYDPATGVMIDATGNYEWDWEAMNLF